MCMLSSKQMWGERVGPGHKKAEVKNVNFNYNSNIADSLSSSRLTKLTQSDLSWRKRTWFPNNLPNSVWYCDLDRALEYPSVPKEPCQRNSLDTVRLPRSATSTWEDLAERGTRMTGLPALMSSATLVPLEIIQETCKQIVVNNYVSSEWCSERLKPMDLIG